MSTTLATICPYGRPLSNEASCLMCLEPIDSSSAVTHTGENGLRHADPMHRPCFLLAIRVANFHEPCCPICRERVSIEGEAVGEPAPVLPPVVPPPVVPLPVGVGPRPEILDGEELGEEEEATLRAIERGRPFISFKWLEIRGAALANRLNELERVLHEGRDDEFIRLLAELSHEVGELELEDPRGRWDRAAGILIREEVVEGRWNAHRERIATARGRLLRASDTFKNVRGRASRIDVIVALVLMAIAVYVAKFFSANR